MSFFGYASKLFLVLNVLHLFLAIGVVTIGSLVICQCSEFSTLLFYGFLSVPIWVLVIGVLLLLLSIYGIIAGYTEKTCLLYTYATFIAIFFLAGLTLLIYVCIHNTEADERFRNELDDLFEEYRSQDDDEVDNRNETTQLDEAIDKLQQNLQCCGVDSFSDWFDLQFGTVPESCCMNVTVCNVESQNPTGIYKRGCYETAIEQLGDTSLAMVVISVLLVIFQGLCFILACGLSAAINKYQYVY